MSLLSDNHFRRFLKRYYFEKEKHLKTDFLAFYLGVQNGTTYSTEIKYIITKSNNL